MELIDYIELFLKDFVTILGEMSPYLLLGFFFAGALYAFMPRQQIEKYFSGTPFKSSLFASLFGVPLPLCSCGVIPTGAALYKNGASKGGTVSFLISTPQTGVDSILATFSLLGLPFAIIRPIAAFITGVTGGVITSHFTKNETVEPKSYQEQKTGSKSFGQKVKDLFNYGFVEFIQDVSKWLVVGLVLAAVVSASIPDNFFELLNLSPILQMLLILTVSIPLYICATGTVPLAAVLLLKGISPGAAFVLLMAGPATNAATITMIGKVLGKRSLFTYLGAIIGGALLFGILIDYAFPAEWFTKIVGGAHSHSHGEGLAWWETLSGVVLALLIVNGYIQKKFNIGVLKKEDSMTVKTIKVDGMSCNHCKASVESNLERLDSITTAKANLADRSVTIEGDNLNIDEAVKTIEALGFKPNKE